MEKAEKLSKLNRVELRVYEILGIKLFRKAILLFERIKHSKDGSRNENYHPQNISISTLKSFSGYLLYNAMFHVISLFFCVAYFTTTCFFKIDYLWLDILMYAIVIFDFYCIMLQRYIYVRMKVLISKFHDKRDRHIHMCVEKIIPFLEKKEEQELIEENNLIQKITQSTITGCDCVLSSECVAILERLAVVVDCLNMAKTRVKQNVVKSETLGQVIFDLKSKRYVFGRAERCVSRLQRLVQISESRNVMFGYSIVTDCAECEVAYRRLFSDNTREGIELILTVLLLAYQREGLVQKR